MLFKKPISAALREHYLIFDQMGKDYIQTGESTRVPFEEFKKTHRLWERYLYLQNKIDPAMKIYENNF